MNLSAELYNFYKGKQIFVTGHTGFKGTWLCLFLSELGAHVTGYALPASEESIFNTLKLSDFLHSHLADVRNFSALEEIFLQSKSEIVFHLAAQALVRESYADPLSTYSSNVMGTLHLLEAVRKADFVKSVVNVTTDKVYENAGLHTAFVETDVLDGHDPYSNSKSCSELLTASYRRSFFSERDTAISTMRAGNVIGGGDFAKDRIVPDCVRHSLNKEPIILRNPKAIRPYQHVLEPIFAYLVLAMRQWQDKHLQGAYNVGPDEKDCLSTGDLATLFCKYWQDGASWVHKAETSVHEAGYLKLNCQKLANTLQLKPKWNIDKTMQETVVWYKEYQKTADIVDMRHFMTRQIQDYLKA